MYFSPVFWESAFERFIKTVAQTAVSLLTVEAGGLIDVDWVAIASAAGLAGIASILTSIAGVSVGTVGDPSLVKPVREHTPVTPEASLDEAAGPVEPEVEYTVTDEVEMDLTPVPPDYDQKH